MPHEQITGICSRNIAEAGRVGVSRRHGSRLLCSKGCWCAHRAPRDVRMRDGLVHQFVVLPVLDAGRRHRRLLPTRRLSSVRDLSRRALEQVELGALAAPPFPFGRCGDGLAAAQLRPANDEKRRFHGRTQAREFGWGKLTNRHQPGIVVTHDSVSLFVFESVRDRPVLVRGKKRTPDDPGAEVITMNTHHKNRRIPTAFRGSGRSNVLAFSQREHLSRALAVNLRSRLLALLPPNSGERFSNIRFSATRVTKGITENRFH